MKKNFVALISIASIVLCGCHIIPKNSNKSTSNSSGSSNSSTTSSSSSSKTGTVDIQIYATNDIHGQVIPSGSCPGIGKLGTYLKQRKSEPNTLIFDQGDAWQGSIYSNLNHGAAITDIMNYVHYDARCIGNHDFDWGLDAIKANNIKTYDGYATPVLAGNIYDYNFDTKTTGTVQQSDIGVKSVVLNIDDLKIGVLGGIGQDQITSINSLFTRDLTFKNHIPFIKEEATYLREQEKCDIVIGSIHTGQGSLIGNELNNYVDLFLCGHTHIQETYQEGNTYYVQCKGYEQSFSHITLTYDYQTKSISNTNVSFLLPADINTSVTSIDPKIQSILDEYNVDSLANTVYANNVSGYFDRYEGTSNLMSKAILDRTLASGYNDIAFALINDARTALPNRTSWTYADIFQSFPFDNAVYIASASGRELQKMLGYSGMHICRNPSFTNNTLSLDENYKIAVLDYVYFHTNVNRYYDYFNLTGGTSSTTLTNHYRDILINWLTSNNYNSGTLLSNSTFANSTWNHNKSAFSFV